MSLLEEKERWRKVEVALIARPPLGERRGAKALAYARVIMVIDSNRRGCTM